jgi:hypothetical protein
MSAARTSIAALLLAAALVAGAFSLVAHWTQQHLLDNDRWTAAMAPLIERPGVQETVTTALVDSLADNGLPAGVKPLATQLTARVVASAQFAGVWSSAVRVSHEQLVAGLREKGTGVVVDDRAVSVDLGALFDSVAPRLSALGIPLVSSLPRPTGEVVLDSSPEVVNALKAARFLDRWATPSLIAAVLLALAGIAVAPRRARALVLTGAVAAVLAVVALVGWLILRQVALDGADPIAEAVLRSLTSDISGWLIVAAGVGVVAVVAGVVAERVRPGI